MNDTSAILWTLVKLAIVVLAVFYVVKVLFFRRTAQKNIIPATHLLRIWI